MARDFLADYFHIHLSQQINLFFIYFSLNWIAQFVLYPLAHILPLWILFYFLLYSLWCCRCRYHPPSLLTRRIIFYPQKCIPKNPGRSARSCIQWLGCPRNGNKKLFFIHEAKQQFETFILFFSRIYFYYLHIHQPRVFVTISVA